jgi:hypothetical protein
MSLRLLNLLQFLFHPNLFLYNLYLFTFLLLLLSNNVPLLVFELEMLLLVSDQVIAVPLLSELLHPCVVIVELSLDGLAQASELLGGVAHLVPGITQLRLVLLLDRLEGGRPVLLPLLEVSHLLLLARQVLQQLLVLFLFLQSTVIRDDRFEI